MDDRADSDITAILLRARAAQSSDGPELTNRLLEAVYDELRRAAERCLRGERPDHTLQPTELVHEAYLKLIDQTKTAWQDRAHFIAVAARAMRQILIDHARGRLAQKRGGGAQRVTLDSAIAAPGSSSDQDVLALHDALEKLGDLDPRAAQVAELRIFGGLSAPDTAEVIGASERTVRNDWVFARSWLTRELTS